MRRIKAVKTTVTAEDWRAIAWAARRARLSIDRWVYRRLRIDRLPPPPQGPAAALTPDLNPQR